MCQRLLIVEGAPCCTAAVKPPASAFHVPMLRLSGGGDRAAVVSLAKVKPLGGMRADERTEGIGDALGSRVELRIACRATEPDRLAGDDSIPPVPLPCRKDGNHGGARQRREPKRPFRNALG